MFFLKSCIPEDSGRISSPFFAAWRCLLVLSGSMSFGGESNWRRFCERVSLAIGFKLVFCLSVHLRE